MMMLKMMMPSVPKMPGGDDGEKKEESAESREEAKEQVGRMMWMMKMLRPGKVKIFKAAATVHLKTYKKLSQLRRDEGGKPPNMMPMKSGYYGCCC